MTEKQAILEYLGGPTDREFNSDDYLGRYGGLINIVGLRHKGLVVSGTRLYNIVNELHDGQLNKWEFLHELAKWSAKYTGTQRHSKALGKKQVHKIEKGVLHVAPAKYFCVPSEAL